MSKIPSDNHAHIHCAAIDLDPSLKDAVISKLGQNPVVYNNYNDFIDNYTSRPTKHYLLVEENNKINVFYINNIDIESQFLRKRLAECVNEDPEKANWMKSPGWDLIDSEIIKLKDQFNIKHKNKYRDNEISKLLSDSFSHLSNENIIDTIGLYTNLYEYFDLDSIELIYLIVKIESTFNISLTPEDITYENFKNLYKIYKLLRKYV